MARSADIAAILTFHSISDEPGPTSIAPDIFAAQMTALADSAVDVVPLSAIEEWLNGARAFDAPAVAITFDDAFADFADNAFPVLKKFGFPATVFVPTGVVGGAENWGGANEKARALMDWAQIEALDKAGVSFGSHTQSHADLTTLDEAALEAELSASRNTLEAKLGRPAPHFAPPYGRSNEQVRKAIARRYGLSVGVRLGEVRRSSPIDDLPRIEMFYFGDIAQWRAFLNGEARLYFAMRRALRGVREMLRGLTRKTAY